MNQKIITSDNHYRQLDEWIKARAEGPVLLVCGSSIRYLTELDSHLRDLDARAREGRGGHEIVRFSDFQPNPLYESVVSGVRLFHEKKCAAVMAVGGGSAMDVAKCIKLYANMDPEKNYLDQEIVPNNIPFLAMPTTAGTGSEATRFAVIYYGGVKQSVNHVSGIPETVLMDPAPLKTLPDYQKKVTMLDALCHAIESFWSVNSTPESRQHSRTAIELVLSGMEGYLAGTDEGCRTMLEAAYRAGQAINLAQTTAGHAMCYKITSLCGCAHGHSVALCNRVLFPWMVENTDRCVDPRGEAFLRDILDQIGAAMGCASAKEGAAKLDQIFRSLDLEIPVVTEADIAVMKTSVNPVRLKNHPVRLDEETIDMLYRRILRVRA